MCKTCGCSDGHGARVSLPDGNEATDAQADADRLDAAVHYRPLHPHGHLRRGRGHRHPVRREDEHAHGHEHEHAHAHAHAHEHAHAHAHEHEHEHEHGHGHGHAHEHPHSHIDDDDSPAQPEVGIHEPPAASGTTVSLQHDLLEKNDRLAARNRGWFEGREILALNLVSSPGSGKTTLLERTIRDLGGALPISVISGDQETANDARRIGATGCKAVQINTGAGCHLDAEMVARGLDQLQPSLGSVVLIENVGNLVCPALFDLGERAKVAILSVTEGEDKPAKYPHMFRAARLMLLSKTDLLPHLRFDVARCIAYARHINPRIEVIELSSFSGDGLTQWYDWLRAEFAGNRNEAVG